LYLENQKRPKLRGETTGWISNFSLCGRQTRQSVNSNGAAPAGPGNFWFGFLQRCRCYDAGKNTLADEIFPAVRFWSGAIHGTFLHKINRQDAKARRKNVRRQIQNVRRMDCAAASDCGIVKL
jgi:hypothetical protein